jgi:hypothetical protein
MRRPLRGFPRAGFAAGTMRQRPRSGRTASTRSDRSSRWLRVLHGRPADTRPLSFKPDACWMNGSSQMCHFRTHAPRQNDVRGVAVNFISVALCLRVFSSPAAYATIIASARLWRRLCLLRQLQNQRRSPPRLRRTHRRFTAPRLSTEPPHQPSPGIALTFAQRLVLPTQVLGRQSQLDDYRLGIPTQDDDGR